MQLARMLKLIGLDVFPCAHWFDAKKNKWMKAPRTLGGESWRDTAKRDYDEIAALWDQVELCSIVLPENVVIIDLDTYEGVVSTTLLDGIFAEAVPWDKAYIQRSISGGHHFAFRVPQGWKVRQGDAHLGLKGFDTKVGGKGTITTGNGYQAADPLGVMRLANPAILPVLPDACRPFLELVEVEQKPREIQTPTHDTASSVIIEALSFIDPTTRDTWRKVGYAMKDLGLPDDEAFALWDTWSAGGYSNNGCPEGYASDTQRFQWDSFQRARNDGGTEVRAASLYYLAMEKGWKPPRNFDTRAAFGNDACSNDKFSALLERITQHGGNPEAIAELKDAILTSTNNALQQALLFNALEQQLKEVGLFDKTLRTELRRGTETTTTASLPGMYGKSDAENAELFLSRCYPDNTLLRINETLYRYTGRCWEIMTKEELAYEVDKETSLARLQQHQLNAMVSRILTKLSNTRHGEMIKMNGNTGEKLVFSNGVFDIRTQRLEPHSAAYYTTQYKPYAYDPSIPCMQWLMFLNSIFDGDQARINLLQEWMGYLLVSDYRFHKMMMMVGPPRSGKGTIGKVINEIVGQESFSGGELSSFAEDAFLDSIAEKNAVFIGDAERKVSAQAIGKVVGRLKEISGNDQICFNRKFKSAVTTTIKAKITIASNTIPMLFDDSGAFGSRMLVLVFSHSFLGQEDPNLFDRLKLERSGIVAWALAGLQRLYANNGVFTKSEVGDIEREYIEESFNPLKQFLEETCELDKTALTSSGDLHQTYVAWAINNGDSPLTRRAFTSAVKDNLRGTNVVYKAHWSREDYKSIRGFKGLRIKGQTQTRTAGAFQPRVVK